MKKLSIILHFLMIGIFFSHAQKKVEKIELNGDTYTVSKVFPKEILGKYLYEKKGEPIVELYEN